MILGRDFSIQNCIGISWTKVNTCQLTQNNEVIAATEEYQPLSRATVTQWIQKDLWLPQEQVPLERFKEICTPTLQQMLSMCQTQHQNAAAEKQAFPVTTPAYGIHSNGLNWRISQSIKERQQIHTDSHMHVNRIHILHTTQIKESRGCHKCLHQPHLLSLWTFEEDTDV